MCSLFFASFVYVFMLEQDMFPIESLPCCTVRPLSFLGSAEQPPPACGQLAAGRGVRPLAMDLAAVLAMAADVQVAAAPAGAAQVRRGLPQMRSLSLVKKGRKLKWRTLAKIWRRQYDAQARHFNVSGAARTADHELPLFGERRRKARGKGRWRTWNPEAVVKAAFALESSQSDVKRIVGSGSGGHGSLCRNVVAHATIDVQRRGLKRLQGRQDVVVFMNNLMFDETKLPLLLKRSGGGAGGHRSYSTLASDSQVSMALDDGTVFDEDVVRPQKVLRRANGRCTWAALTDPSDPAGLRPGVGDASWTNAKYVATVVACDGSSVNLSVLKHLEHTLPRDHLLLVCFCMQHRTGAIVEVITELLGIMGAVQCIGNAFRGGDFLQDLTESVRAVLQKDMCIVPVSSSSARTAASERAMAEEILGAALGLHPSEQDGGQSDSESDADVVVDPAVKQANRRRLAHIFVGFLLRALDRTLSMLCIYVCAHVCVCVLVCVCACARMRLCVCVCRGVASS